MRENYRIDLLKGGCRNNIFYFYSNEHEPIHVHVIHVSNESVFDIIMSNGELSEICVREKSEQRSLPVGIKRLQNSLFKKT